MSDEERRARRPAPPERRDGEPRERRDDERRPPRDRPDDGGAGERRRPPDDAGPRDARRTRDDAAAPRRDPDGPARRPRLDALAAAERAGRGLQALTSRTVEGVVGVAPAEDGSYTVTVEVLETARVPNTADVLAEYEVEIDPDGGLRAYRRRDRYTRGSTRSD